MLLATFCKSQAQDSTFYHLDKSTVTSGILLDTRNPTYSILLKCNGTTTALHFPNPPLRK